MEGHTRWAEALLDRLVVEGSCLPAVFLCLAMLLSREADLMRVADAETLQTALRTLPWTFPTDEIPAVLARADALAEETPVSAVCALRGAASLASAGLLPRAVCGSPRLWHRRLETLYR